MEPGAKDSVNAFSFSDSGFISEAVLQPEIIRTKRKKIDLMVMAEVLKALKLMKSRIGPYWTVNRKIPNLNPVFAHEEKNSSFPQKLFCCQSDHFCDLDDFF
jgi:hypothetical protein